MTAAKPTLCAPPELPAPASALRLVMIEWEDSAQPTAAWEWVDEYELDKAIVCVSVGYVIAESEHAIAIAANLGDVGKDRAQASGIIRIPRSAVRATKPLAP